MPPTTLRCRICPRDPQSRHPLENTEALRSADARKPRHSHPLWVRCPCHKHRRRFDCFPISRQCRHWGDSMPMHSVHLAILSSPAR